MDGIPELELWDLIVTVLHGNTHQQNQGDEHIGFVCGEGFMSRNRGNITLGDLPNATQVQVGGNCL